MPIHKCEKCGKKDRRRFEGKQLECKKCGKPLKCPVCGDDEDAPGWFTTDEGESLPCHACNNKERVRRQRRGINV